MKPWVIILLIAVFVLVIVPLIYFAIVANSIKKTGNGIPVNNFNESNDCGTLNTFAAPPDGMKYACINKQWQLVAI